MGLALSCEIRTRDLKRVPDVWVLMVQRMLTARLTWDE